MYTTIWAVNLSEDKYDEYAPHFGKPSEKFKTVERQTKQIGDGLSLVMTIYANNSSPYSTLWSQMALYKNEQKIACSKDAGDIDEELVIEHDDNRFTAKFVKPDNTVAYVHQRPVDMAFDCPTCEQNFDISYDDFCTAHGDPSDWEFSRIKCPYCGQELIVTHQDWS